MLLQSNISSQLEKLLFYETELKKFTITLEKAVLSIEKKYLVTIEHFQNQFLIQQKNINKLKHEIRILDKWSSQNTTPLAKLKRKNYALFLAQKVQGFHNVVEDLIREFKSFFRNEFLNFHFTF